MSKNMTILDRRLRGVLGRAGRARSRDPGWSCIGRLDRAVRDRRRDARDQRRRLLPAVFPRTCGRPQPPHGGQVKLVSERNDL